MHSTCSSPIGSGSKECTTTSMCVHVSTSALHSTLTGHHSYPLSSTVPPIYLQRERGQEGEDGLRPISIGRSPHAVACRPLRGRSIPAEGGSTRLPLRRDASAPLVLLRALGVPAEGKPLRGWDALALCARFASSLF